MSEAGREPGMDRLRRVEALYHQVVGRPSAEREAALLAACPDDAEMRDEIRSLLAQSDSAAGFLSSPAIAVAAASVSKSAPSLTGRRVGVFEVRELLGVGGMGEVYRARDLKLGRDVAIKILPRAFKDDPDRAARFQREAHLLASLNHPNIGAVYGLEDAEDLQALVLELVEGEDLSERLTRGAIPVAEALPIARQIAEAIEAAHERGVIHRDLKPGNIKLRADGTVKVLDFGLAKAMAPVSDTAADPTKSPTLTDRATKVGMILGTAAYMAPEQALGKPVDRRADIWSFGAVLYEMLTGRRAFKGADVPTTLSAVLSETPSFDALPPSAPPRIRRLLERCLDRDHRTRLRDIGEARVELARAEAGVPDEDRATSPQSGPRPSVVIALLTAIAAITSVTTLILWAERSAPHIGQAETRLALPLGGGLRFNGIAAHLAVSRDGRSVALAAMKGPGGSERLVGGGDLYLRRLDDMTLKSLGEPGMSPFFSPDGRWVGFFNDGRLRKVPTGGGAATDIATDSLFGDADWGEDDGIVFSDASERPIHGIRRVSASGGPLSVVTSLDQAAGHSHHLAPQILPGGQWVVFTIRSVGPRFQVAVVPSSGGAPRVIVEDALFGRYVGDGVLLFQRGSAIFATRFAAETATVSGEGVPVLEGVYHFWRSPTWAAARGTFVYRPAEDDARRLVWVRRDGVEEAINAPARKYTTPRLSPRGDRIAVGVDGPGISDVWTFALGSGRFQPEFKEGRFPVWTPDGAHLLVLRPSRVPEILSLPVDGSGRLEPLVQLERVSGPEFMTKDKATLVYAEINEGTGYDITAMDLRTNRARALVATPAFEGGAQLHPNGKWMAYATDLNDRNDVFVTPFPEAGPRIPVTIDGGREPAWSRDGSELFYRSGRGMFSAKVRPGPSLSFEPPKLLFDGDYYMFGLAGYQQYDVAPDGRFLMMKTPEREAQHLGVILNWGPALTAAVSKP